MSCASIYGSERAAYCMANIATEATIDTSEEDVMSIITILHKSSPGTARAGAACVNQH